MRTAMMKVQSDAEPTDTFWHKVIFYRTINGWIELHGLYEGWNFNSGNYLFTTDTK